MLDGRRWEASGIRKELQVQRSTGPIRLKELLQFLFRRLFA